MLERLSTKKIVLLVAVVFFLSSFFQYSINKDLKITNAFFGLPQVYTGDEPEYLVALNSLLFDSDFKLCNNFLQAAQGGLQAGKFYAGIDKIVPRECTESKEWLPGRAVFNSIAVAAFVWVFSSQPWLLEPMAIFLTLAVSLVTVFFSIKILETFGFSRKIIAICALVLSFASPFWFYSKTFWAEPFLSMFLVVSLYFFLEKKLFLSGIFSAINFLVKPTTLLFAMVFFAFGFFDKKKPQKDFLLGFAIVLPLFFLINYFIYGSILFVPQSSTGLFGNVLAGASVELFSTNFGLLFSFPLFVFALLGFAFFFKKQPTEAALFLSILAGYILLWAQMPWIVNGTGGYSFRYLIPLIPIMIIPIGFFLKENKSKTAEALFWIVFTLSFLINIQAALTPFLINNPPWFLLQKLFFSLFN